MELITEGLSTFTEWLFTASIKSALLIVAILVARYGLKKYVSASARHSLWLCVFICLSIPFGWELSIYSNTDTILVEPNNVRLTALESVTKNNTSEENQLHHQSAAEPITTMETSPQSIQAHTLLSYLWFIVFLCLSAITLWQVQRFNRIKNTASIANQQQEQLLNNCRSTCGLNKRIPLLYSTRIQSPLTFGLFKPTIILPTGIEQQLTKDQLTHVLLHELGHIQRKDILWNWLAHWATLLHWFNPAVWFAYKTMKADMEIACDAKVLTHLSQQDRNDYGLTLINVSQLSSKNTKLSHSLGILENHHELKNRLIMMKEFTTMNLKKSLVFGFVFSASALVAFAQPETKPKEVSGHISAESSISLQQFAAQAERDLKTKILIGINSDSRIQANTSDSPISYEQLLTQLQINGFTAFKTKDYIQILSVRDARTMAPIAEKGKTYYADEFVTDYIRLEKACAASVLATVRPLVPQYSFLSTYADAKTLIIVDSFSNIVRVRNVVATIEKNLDAPKDCERSNTIERPQQASKK